jgi:hypothetical protein
MTSNKPRLTILSQGMVTRKGNMPCNLCRGEIAMNSDIVIKTTTTRNKSFKKWYHEKCARSVNII